MPGATKALDLSHPCQGSLSAVLRTTRPRKACVRHSVLLVSEEAGIFLLHTHTGCLQQDTMGVAAGWEPEALGRLSLSF